MTLDFDAIYILNTLGLLKEGFDKLRSVSILTKILWGFHETLNYRISSYSSHPWIVSAPLCTVTFGLIYCDLWISKFKKEYIVSAETIWGNTVDKMQVKNNGILLPKLFSDKKLLEQFIQTVKGQNNSFSPKFH